MRIKDNYYNMHKELNVLTDEEYNELVNIEKVFTILSTTIPEDENNPLSNYVSDYLIERNRRSWNIITTATIRLSGIVRLCTA